MKTTLAPLLFAIALLAACGSDPGTPEAQIEALFDRAEQAAEAGDVGALREMVADDYADGLGNDRSTVLRLVQFHLLQHRGVHLFRQTRELHIPQPGRAVASILVAMAATPLPDRDALAAARADLYRFDIELTVESGEWVVTGAQWRRAQLADFLR